VAVEGVGRKLVERTVGTTSEDPLTAVQWASQWSEVRFALQDCRQVTRRLERDLPIVRLDGPAREVKLLADHRHHLVVERTEWVHRLRWHLHDLDPALQIPTPLLRARQPRRPTTSV
jgi:hypothetical protein